jgi:PEP-CTERM motif
VPIVASERKAAQLIKSKAVAVLVAFLALILSVPPAARADGSTLLISGTTTFGGGVETISLSFELQNDEIVPGSVDIETTGPVSFVGSTYVQDGAGFGCGFNQWNSLQPDSILQVTFYEDGPCAATGQPQISSVGLVYFQCGPSDGCPYVISDFEGFVHATESPEPSSLFLLGVSLMVLAGMRRNRSNESRRRNA